MTSFPYAQRPNRRASRSLGRSNAARQSGNQAEGAGERVQSLVTGAPPLCPSHDSSHFRCKALLCSNDARAQSGTRPCIVGLMARIALIYAHPYPNRSRANRSLLSSVRGLDGVRVRSLYERYPDFAIDVDAEQELLARRGADRLAAPALLVRPAAADEPVVREGAGARLGVRQRRRRAARQGLPVGTNHRRRRGRLPRGRHARSSLRQVRAAGSSRPRASAACAGSPADRARRASRHGRTAARCAASSTASG